MTKLIESVNMHVRAIFLKMYTSSQYH